MRPDWTVSTSSSPRNFHRIARYWSFHFKQPFPGRSTYPTIARLDCAMWRTVWAHSSVQINIVSCLCPSETEWTSTNGNLIIMFCLGGGVPWLLSIQKSACCPIFKIELHKWKIICPTFKSCVMLEEYSIMRVHLLLVIFFTRVTVTIDELGVSGQSHSQVLLMVL